MGSILNDSDRAAICSRMRALSDSSTARWGRMSVTGMLQHLRLSAQMAVGELTVASSNKRAFQVFPLKHLILYVLPFPKGAPTARELYPGEAASLEEERAALLALLDRIGAGPREGAGPAHPLFGTLSWREWGAVTFKHADHHLKQFGA
ncbi:MAG TPA: DUF1569 domain-containing protein [Pyrinomonadaceae bacterium]|nr:DUF1569 domain-containing protein [Pyrinomonadaceae bacterium]